MAAPIEKKTLGWMLYKNSTMLDIWNVLKWEKYQVIETYGVLLFYYVQQE